MTAKMTYYLVNLEKVSLTLLEFWVDSILQTELSSLISNKSDTKMRSSIFVGSVPGCYISCDCNERCDYCILNI